MSDKIKKPSAEGSDIAETQAGHVNDYRSEAVGTKRSGPPSELSEDLADPTTRGGQLGSKNSMPAGGDSTRRSK